MKPNDVVFLNANYFSPICPLVILHHWYRSLDYTFGRGMKTNSRGVMFKTVADQLIYAPFAITMFFGYVSTMKALHGPTTCTASSGGNEISNAIDNGSDNVSNHPMTTSSPSIPSMAMSSFQQQMVNISNLTP